MAFMGAGIGKKGILSCDVKDVSELHKIYLPYIENGGIFVRTNHQYKLGEEIFLLFSMLNEEKSPITGKVVWITPPGATGIKHTGIGIQFSDNSDVEKVRTKIETILAPFKGELLSTETM